MAKRGVIIVAGGAGRRMGATLPKQFMMLGNILRRTIPLFRKCLVPSALLGGGLLRRLAVDHRAHLAGLEGNGL